jgi:predicted adenylyl cyclase CyaB
MEKNIEVEIRGPLSKKKFGELVKLFEKEGKKKSEKNRVLIDYSTFLEGGIEDRKKDIRLRSTNKVPEIIVKIGTWGENEQRKELSIFGKLGEFDTMVEVFGELGYKKGMLCERKSQVYDYKGIEFALVEVPGHSYYYEAEKMADKNENADKLIIEIKKVCKELGLDVFDKDHFFKYVQDLNKDANEIFDYDEYVSGYFKERFGI